MKKNEDVEKRKMILVAREGVLSELLEGTWLDQGEFPTKGHRDVILLLWRETCQEMWDLGLELEYEF